MLQHEFESRVGIKVSESEYLSINAVYEHSDVEKDEFCKFWRAINRNRIKAYKEREAEEAKQQQNTDRLRDLFWRIDSYSNEKKQTPCRCVFSDKDLALLHSNNFEVDRNKWGGYITAMDIQYELGKHLGVYKTY